MRTTDEWLSALHGVVPVAPVRSLADALDDEELEERGILVSYDHPVLGTIRQVASPITLSDYQPAYQRAPALDGDREALLGELGLNSP